MNRAYLVLLFVALQRLAEVALSSRHERALRARGGVEVGRGHYPLIVLLHGAWLAAILMALGREPAIHVVPLVLFGVLQVLRAWIIRTLGPFWTTRVITIPGEPLIKTGPYRFVRHPNYLVVIGEMALLPLVFGQVWNAVIFSILNLALIGWRIRVENAALAPRAGLPSR
jgi:methyltransferase